MNITYSEQPKDVILINGFPGFGMVGSVATEFLQEHLKVRQIATVVVDELPPVAAVHKGKLVPPIGIFYSEDHNIAIINALTKGDGQEWMFAGFVKQVADDLQAKEIISLEGVSGQLENPTSFAFATEESKRKELAEKEFKLLDESIIMGVSAALFLKKINITAFFAMTMSTLPDSAAAAELIKALDKYLGLKVDYNPLYDQAKEFEEKIKGLMSKSKTAASEKEKSMLNYMG